MKYTWNNRPEAEPGDIIDHKQRTIVISEVITSDYSDTGWIIEGRDQYDRYFIWKQYYDGGLFVSREDYLRNDAPYYRQFEPLYDQLYGAEEGEEQ